MSQVKIISLKPFLPLLLSVLLLAACGGDSHSPAHDTHPTSETHPAGWLPDGHALPAKIDVQMCADCHGNDFSGGYANVACTQCHLGNEKSIHPTLWGNFAYALHANYAKLNGTASCANVNCHGANLEGIQRSGPSCTLCHMGGVFSKHPVAWNGNIDLHKDYVASNGSPSCRVSVCHGADLKGVFLSGPSCGTCHSFPF